MQLNIVYIFRCQSLKIVRTFGRAGLMLFHTLIGKLEFSKNLPIFLYQLYNLGVLPIVVIVISGLFIGMVFGLQGYMVLINYNAEERLGAMVTISLLRELGPVITALLFTGHNGLSLTIEIGLMRITEQLSGMEMMAVDPLRRIISPRFWAGIISLPLLTIIFIAFGIWGCLIIGVYWKNIDIDIFWSTINNLINLRVDLINCIIKSVIFAITITWIALFNGYDSIPTILGINRAATSTFIYSSIFVLGLDFILTLLMF